MKSFVGWVRSCTLTGDERRLVYTRCARETSGSLPALELTMPRRAGNVWEITGWDSFEQIFQTTVSCAKITEVQLHALLRALAAKFGLTPREIVGSYLKRRAKGYMPHLEISKSNSTERRTTDHSCGDNPYFIARVLRPNDPPSPRAGATVSSNSRSNGRATSSPLRRPSVRARRSPKR